MRRYVASLLELLPKLRGQTGRCHMMDTWIYRICSQCGEEKEVCCLVDGEPWCEECFERALGDGEEKD